MITHRIPLTEAPDAYEKFRKKTDGCIKVVIKPGMDRTAPVPLADQAASAAGGTGPQGANPDKGKPTPQR